MKLWRRRGWGSAIIEVQAAAYGLPLERVEVGDLFADPAARRALAAVNPQAQIPVLELDGGRIMTESAAITLHLADLTGSDLLVPGPRAAERADFLRWLVWLVASVYPCFTYGDDPSRFVADPEAAAAFKARVRQRLAGLWREAEAAAGAPWFLGARLSALDVYVAVMTDWQPGRDWFRAEAPRLWAIREGVAAHPGMAAAFAENAEAG